MNMMAHRQLPASAQEAAIARASGQLLSRYARSKEPLRLREKPRVRVMRVR